ncbi:MAG: M28 family peptidase [Saprospiraceae bacterium]|nr:M28 family peptidase [Saprospiraceae bacterium]
MKIRGLIYLFFILAFTANVSAQNTDEDAFFIKKIHDKALSDSKCYDWLYHMSENIGARLSGSDEYNIAADYTEAELRKLGVDKIWRQTTTVDYWDRGSGSSVRITDAMGHVLETKSLALGKSVGTPPGGITAEVIEVKSLDEVEQLGREKIEGKIVFYNRPLDPTHLNTFRAYGGAVDQRGNGASKASEYGALGVLVRSMTTRQDDVPHTGSLRYKEGVKPIPGIAISTNDANKLSTLLKDGEQPVMATMEADCNPAGERPSDNIIAEIKGSEFPDEIILVGGHLDSWDVGGGAHDDGAGCVHSMEVIHILKALNYQPKRTIRCVLFANEENGLAGGREYARISNENGEFHLAAIESDSGGFVPRGFTMDGTAAVLESYAKQINDWLPLLEPYGLWLKTGGSGADISPLKSQNGLLMGLRPDSQRYFDFHHTATDRIGAVNQRELELGAATMATMVFLIDKYGLKRP